MEITITGIEQPTAQVNAVPAMGGTELMFNRLKAGLNPELFDKVQLVLSQHQPLDGRPSILWLHDLPQQPGPVSALANEGWKRYNRIVFVSHWQREMFHLQYRDMPLERTTVIYNGIEPQYERNIPKEAPEHFKFIYASTPHRGLQLLPDVLTTLGKFLPSVSFSCDVYSSFKLYGRPDDDKQLEDVFKIVKAHPKITYHGTVSNQELRQAMRQAHVLVYPNVYMETFCLTGVEAMAEGMALVAPGYGALPEVAGRWAHLFPMTNVFPLFIANMASELGSVIRTWQADPASMAMILTHQMLYMNTFYQFDTRIPEWEQIYDDVIDG